MSIYRYTKRSLVRELAFCLGALVFCVPAYFLVTLSLKSPQEIYANPLALPSSLSFTNYSDAWQTAHLGSSLVNSLVITAASVAAMIVLGSLCAYAIAHLNNKLGGVLYATFVLGLIMPIQLAVIPLYSIMRNLGLVGNDLGMVLLYTALGMPLTVMLYVGFIRALPAAYEEAAQTDGAGLFRRWFRVIFPMLKPVTATVAILNGLLVWNDFFLPLIFLSGSGNETLPLALYSFVGEYNSQWQLIMAAVGISTLPILGFYLFAQRHLMQGFAGGIRG